MIKNIIAIETEVGLKKFSMQCENSASLAHCLEAVKFFEAYIQERIKQSEPEEKKEDCKSCE